MSLGPLGWTALGGERTYLALPPSLARTVQQMIVVHRPIVKRLHGNEIQYWPQHLRRCFQHRACLVAAAKLTERRGRGDAWTRELGIFANGLARRCLRRFIVPLKVAGHGPQVPDQR